MSEPLNDNGLKHFLKFNNFEPGTYEITEPIGFDASNLVVKQDSKRYARDVSFAGGESDLEFSSIVNTRGLTHEFERLIRGLDLNGFELDVEYILKVDGNNFVVGQLDFSKYETDQINYLSCKVIQQNARQLIKRRFDVNVDLLSNKDVDGNEITPLTTERFFYKATPTVQISKWKSPQPSVFQVPQNSGDTTDPFANVNIIVVSQIQDTLSYLRTRNISTTDGYIFAQNNLTNVKFDLTEFSVSFNQPNVGIELIYRIGANFSDDVDHILDTWTGDQNNINESYDLPDIQRGQSLWIYWNFTNLQPFVNATTVTMNSAFYEISAISTSISTTVEGVRLFDAMSQVVKSISGLNIDAPRFSQGGEFYNQFILSGNLFRGLEEKPFNISLKQIVEYLQELNGDYEVNQNNDVFFGLYEDFYTNNEIISFRLAPNSTFKKTPNERFTVNRFAYNYKKFQENNTTDEEIQNSIEAVHTEVELLTPNKQVENFKEIDIDFIRDPFLIEETRKKNIISKPTSSSNLDDEIFIIDTTTGTPTQEETLILSHQAIGSELKLLNDTSFNWALIGLQVGDVIELDLVNPGTYTVTEIESTVLTLSGSPTFSGQALTKLIYDVTTTDIVNTTNEGFALINGISAEGISNLKFTPKRNIINYYGSYLHTVCDFKEGGTIINTFFKYNGALETRLDSESESITENQNLTVTDLPSKILSSDFYETEVLTEFSNADALIQGLRTSRGFCRITDNENRMVKIHPSEIDFDWSKNLLTIKGEARSESDFLEITAVNDLIFINETGYDTDIVDTLRFNIKNGYVQLYDKNMEALTNRVFWKLFRVNGETPTTIQELASLLINIYSPITFDNIEVTFDSDEITWDG